MANITTGEAGGARAEQAGAPANAAAPRRAANIDFATLIGASGAFIVIALAMVVGGSSGSFVDVPALLIVVGGSFLVTTISFSFDEVMSAQKVMLRTLVYHAERPERAAEQMLHLADRARRVGALALESELPALGHSPFLHRAISLVVDGTPPDEVEQVMSGEVQATALRHQRSTGVLRRAGEVTPAMGLIGTLVGLIQMLGNLDDPSSIGPAMAVALLTTFYGAVLAHMVFFPLASKLERNSDVETMVNHIYALGAASISRQENPRRLETLLNTILPPARRVHFFD